MAKSGTTRLIRVGVSCLLVLLSACVSIPPQPIEQRDGFSQTALSPETIRVLDWNIEKGKAPGFASASGASGFADADLVLLQEACAPRAGTPQTEQLTAAELGSVFAASFQSRFLACADGRATGVLTASRVAPLSTRALMSADREFGLTPKMSLATRYPIAGTRQDLLVVNAHLLNFEWWTIDDYGAQLDHIGEVLAAHDGPILLAGDLNSRNVARQREVDRLAERIGLHPVFTDMNDRRTRAVLGGDRPLDHIYYRGLCLLGSGRIGDEAARERSDHNSLRAVFSVRCPGPV